MKRIKYLVLLTLPLTLLSNSPNRNVEMVNDVSGSIIDTFYTYLLGNYTLTTSSTIPYLDAMIGVAIKDDIYQKATSPVRHSQFGLLIQSNDNSYSQALDFKEYYYVADSDGYTSEQYLKLDNTIGKREVTNSNGKKILFEGNSNSPFYKLNNKKDSLSTYFDIEKTTSGYTFKMTDEGKVLLTTSFINFFPTISSNYLYSFDSRTHQILLNDLSIYTDENGSPLSMEFSKVEQDFYGAVSEKYTSTFSSLESSPSLTPITSTLTSEQRTKLEDKLEELDSGLTYGNFTQDVIVNSHTIDSDSNVSEHVYSYSNYYDLNSYYGSGNKLYLSSLEMTDSTYGSTFIGLAYDSTYEGYYYLAVSPDENYYAALESSVYYSTLSSLIPSFSGISPDLFNYSLDGNNEVYTLDLEDKTFNDYYFSLSILEAILSTSDPGVRYGLFLDNSTSYEFDFKKFYITIKEDGSLTFSIDYKDSYGLDASLETSIKNTNSTNITETNDANINACLKIILDI